MDLGGRGAGEEEGAQVLSEAAAEVEEVEGWSGFEVGEEGWVVGGGGDGEVEEAELADAGIGVDLPCFVTL